MGQQIASRIVQVAVKAFGKIDGVVINHGVLNPGKLSDVSLEEFRHVYDVNVFSYLAIVCYVDSMVHRNFGP